MFLRDEASGLNYTFYPRHSSAITVRDLRTLPRDTVRSLVFTTVFLLCTWQITWEGWELQFMYTHEDKCSNGRDEHTDTNYNKWVVTKVRQLENEMTHVVYFLENVYSWNIFSTQWLSNSPDTHTQIPKMMRNGNKPTNADTCEPLSTPSPPNKFHLS